MRNQLYTLGGSALEKSGALVAEEIQLENLLRGAAADDHVGLAVERGVDAVVDGELGDRLALLAGSVAATEVDDGVSAGVVAVAEVTEGRRVARLRLDVVAEVEGLGGDVATL
mgnify:CR=1 FL=1